MKSPKHESILDSEAVVRIVEDEPPMDIVNPEIPKTTAARLLLARRALKAGELGMLVVGVTPAHIGSEASYILARRLRMRGEQ